MICFFNKYKKSVQKHTDFFDNSFFNAVPDKPLATRNKSHNNQLCTDLSRFNSAYSVVSHFLRFAWQTTLVDVLKTGRINTCNLKPVGGVESYHTERMSAILKNTKYSDIRIIDQSPTGLYEKKSDNLLEL